MCNNNVTTVQYGLLELDNILIKSVSINSIHTTTTSAAAAVQICS